MPRGYSTSEKPSRYQPIADRLAASDTDEVVLTYREVAAIIGHPLPESAILSTSWWTSNNHLHVALWRALGWRASVDRNHLRVTFTRDTKM